ncbi:MAG: C40 family peptidase [Nitrospirae bacterium]|nr:C40 family peptidase [Nitrospirota bacterium]
MDWLNKIILKYGDSGTEKYSSGSYEWKNGGNGADSDGNGKMEYDCSHFLNQVLKDTGYDYTYQSTGQLSKNNSNFDTVLITNLQKGDIVLFNGHVGFFYGYDENGNMLVYSSSGNSRTGANRGPGITPASWFGTPIKFLRPKSNPIPNGDKALNTSRNLHNTAKIIRDPTILSPIVLDLDKDGVETTHLNDGAYFDHDGNGFAEQTGWASSDDGLLVMNRNANGTIDSGKELFGNSTILGDGTKASNGFEALAELDTNADGKVDVSDSAFSQLKVWQDANQDGVSQANELKDVLKKAA